MDAIPREWIDKLFACMNEFYGDRWIRLFKSGLSEEEAKTVWRNGLMGLTYDQIKNALMLCKRSALNYAMMPPHVMEFFQFAKGSKEPYINYHPKANEVKSDPVLARQALDQIRKSLGLRV